MTKQEKQEQKQILFEDDKARKARAEADPLDDDKARKQEQKQILFEDDKARKARAEADPLRG